MEPGSKSVVWMKVIQEWLGLGGANGSRCCKQFRDTSAFRAWDWVDRQEQCSACGGGGSINVIWMEK